MNWKENIEKKYGIRYIEEFPFQTSGQIFVTRCSATKNSILKGIPKELYKSNLISNFIKFCEKYKFRYGILSDLYGIVLMGEIIDWYNLHPSKLNENDFKNLGNKIKYKCKNIDEIFFYNTSPIMSTPYFKMLKYSSIKIYYITKLKINLGGQIRF